MKKGIILIGNTVTHTVNQILQAQISYVQLLDIVVKRDFVATNQESEETVTRYVKSLTKNVLSVGSFTAKLSKLCELLSEAPPKVVSECINLNDFGLVEIETTNVFLTIALNHLKKTKEA
jgi:hypothetical protein